MLILHWDPNGLWTETVVNILLIGTSEERSEGQDRQWSSWLVQWSAVCSNCMWMGWLPSLLAQPLYCTSAFLGVLYLEIMHQSIVCPTTPPDGQRCFLKVTLGAGFTCILSPARRYAYTAIMRHNVIVKCPIPRARICDQKRSNPHLNCPVQGVVGHAIDRRIRCSQCKKPMLDSTDWTAWSKA
jgi:hypothetical protein